MLLIIFYLTSFLGLWKSGCEGVRFHRGGGGEERGKMATSIAGVLKTTGDEKGGGSRQGLPGRD
jgi:hypothetical protein